MRRPEFGLKRTLESHRHKKHLECRGCMGYSVQAIVAVEGTFPAELPGGLAIFRLQKNVQMIPLGAAVREQYAIPLLPLTDDGHDELPPALLALCAKLNTGGAMAYIEAEIFGGEGTQAHVFFQKGRAAGSVVIADDAINVALKLLGVRRSIESDEFDAVGLGKYRETDLWLEVDKR